MKQDCYYMRTSHYLQNIGTQVDQTQDGWKIYKDEGVSGRVCFRDRPMGKKLLKDLDKGLVNHVYVLRLDRMGRDTADILSTIKEIHRHGVGITSKNEGITTMVNGKENPMSNLLITLLSSIAEFEYHRIREKTLDGIARGKRMGLYKGRKKGSIEPYLSFISKPKVKKVKMMMEQGVGVRQICKILECSPNFIAKVKGRLDMKG